MNFLKIAVNESFKQIQIMEESVRNSRYNANNLKYTSYLLSVTGSLMNAKSKKDYCSIFTIIEFEIEISSFKSSRRGGFVLNCLCCLYYIAQQIVMENL
uniref:Uncharacterized protein n=1 Tax=Glossina brevipalpis TaxID=37001 RepID=A0A1A9W2X9_9MUSC